MWSVYEPRLRPDLESANPKLPTNTEFHQKPVTFAFKLNLLLRSASARALSTLRHSNIQRLFTQKIQVTVSTRVLPGPWSWHPPPTKKNQNLFRNYALFMGFRMAKKIIFGLFPFSRKMILKGGGVASHEASANFFPEVLREI